MTTLQSEFQAGVLTLKMNRPERANALNLELLGELQNAFDRAARESLTRVVLLTGEGRAFSAGQDLQEVKAAGGAISFREHLQKSYHPLILKIRRLEKPVIAALNGPCAGAALGIALACDVRLASTEARLVVGFGGIGLVPDSAVSLLLPAMIGMGRAEYFFMTNEPITAGQALEWGLVSQVFPPEEFIKQSNSLAYRLASGPMGAYGLAKKAFNQAILPNLEEALETEAELQELAGKRAEHREGLAAFLERRKPNFD